MSTPTYRSRLSFINRSLWSSKLFLLLGSALFTTDESRTTFLQRFGFRRQYYLLNHSNVIVESVGNKRCDGSFHVHLEIMELVSSLFFLTNRTFLDRISCFSIGNGMVSFKHSWMKWFLKVLKHKSRTCVTHFPLLTVVLIVFDSVDAHLLILEVLSDLLHVFKVPSHILNDLVKDSQLNQARGNMLSVSKVLLHLFFEIFESMVVPLCILCHVVLEAKLQLFVSFLLVIALRELVDIILLDRFAELSQQEFTHLFLGLLFVYLHFIFIPSFWI
jgi:hypothetical protein